ncbi:phospholipid scramblase 3-like [Mercenaria mercenaria]|uniref:phospholipid scramblase 3-like n=1 Tax=Mercenaria mercenaria TaxID=6596 RepID=UPI00234EEF56|nr:phospholipid scramblase 3-like [Mercenaria mercenaria]
MSEVNDVPHIKALDDKVDKEEERSEEKSENRSSVNLIFAVETNVSDSAVEEGKENKENARQKLQEAKETSFKSEGESDESQVEGIADSELDTRKSESSKLISSEKISDKPKTKAIGTKVATTAKEKTVEYHNIKPDLDRQGTDSGDVKISMAEKDQSSQGAVVITTEPQATGPPKPKAKLQRRKSLNPRVMTPPGLEVLDNIQLLAIRQQMDMDIQGGCGAPNTYRIWDDNDEQIFFATEESGCLCRWACGPARQFSLDVFSASDDQVLNFHRTCCRCDCCCCFDSFMCLQKLYVVDCLGRTLGAVKQKFSIFNAKFDIVDHDNNVLFKLLGPCCPCRCATEIYFQILNKTGERQIGRVQKKWGGDRTDNINVDHEYFDVTFPAKLDSVDKGLILGAAFLVNCMYLEMS